LKFYSNCIDTDTGRPFFIAGVIVVHKHTRTPRT
jgi:hypothetical protein